MKPKTSDSEEPRSSEKAKKNEVLRGTIFYCCGLYAPTYILPSGGYLYWMMVYPALADKRVGRNRLRWG
jgi:hypothetical protein